MVVVFLVAGACAAATPSPPPSSPTTSAALDPGVLGLTCGDGHAFHPSLLEAAGSAETDPDAAAAALRAHLGAPEGAGLPRTGWTRVAQTADQAQFLARAPDGSGWLVLGFFVNQGRWVLALAGDCLPRVVLPAGIGGASWRFDPAFPKPGPEAQVLHLLITEQACASGQSPEGRVMPPLVWTTADGLAVAILVRMRPGGQDCQGNPELAIEVDLPEPLGVRRLLDGGVFPPAEPGANAIGG